jgi:hypothetical protein
MYASIFLGVEKMFGSSLFIFVVHGVSAWNTMAYFHSIVLWDVKRYVLNFAMWNVNFVTTFLVQTQVLRTDTQFLIH